MKPVKKLGGKDLKWSVLTWRRMMEDGGGTCSCSASVEECCAGILGEILTCFSSLQ